MREGRDDVSSLIFLSVLGMNFDLPGQGIGGECGCQMG